mmetsp:Transcript_67158/g.119213  ORF Transcript_67158/g.119213 Transcript_67158/m.119213 type:complete len:99 (-) Transcript_67158:2-298(-)
MPRAKEPLSRKEQPSVFRHRLQLSLLSQPSYNFHFLGPPGCERCPSSADGGRETGTGLEPYMAHCGQWPYHSHRAHTGEHTKRAASNHQILGALKPNT